MADKELKISSDRVSAGEEAGDDYTKDLKDIRDSLDKDDNSGTTLGTMVSSQLKMTEAETKYNVRSGIPKKVTGSVQQASQDVKRAAG